MYRDKVIAISAPPYYVVGENNYNKIFQIQNTFVYFTHEFQINVSELLRNNVGISCIL